MRVHKKVLSRTEIALAVFSLAMGIAATWFVHSLNLAKALTDQSAHLNFARLATDSVTPGMSQIGFWPPLLHLLMIPFVSAKELYSSGLAGPIVLIPFLALGTIFLFRISLLLTGNRIMGALAGLLFIINPYVLYYSATPMMEVLFLANLFGVAYYMGSWLKHGELNQLILAGIFITLASLSRFEGLILIPFCSLVVLVELLRQRKSYAEMEALFILFGSVVAIGILFLVSYSWVFGGNPLSFVGGAWLRDPASATSLASFSLTRTVQYILHASYYMLGAPLVFASLASLPILLVFSRQRFLHATILFILFSPLAFIAFNLYRGAITITVPELPPYSLFHNDRYALTWIGFAILTPLIAIHELYGRINSGKKLSVKTHVAVNSMVIFLSLGIHHLYTAAIADQYRVIQLNVNSPVPDQREIAYYLMRHHNRGKVLTGRVDNDPILAIANVPLKDYIYEGNYRYFDQSLREPWLFAGWVLMHNPVTNDPWVKENEYIYKQWGESEEFRRYYELVLENHNRRLYRLNENAVIKLAHERGYDIRFVPSLNPDHEYWDPSDIYARMENKPSAPKIITAEQLVNYKSLAREQLLDFYEERLKPEFEKGYHVNAEGRGNSESQSYGLIQSLWTDDRETFDRVWQWTKQSLQKTDNLFIWKFRVPDDGGPMIVEDSNSATDADTDIAYALLTAGIRWSNPEYTRAALPIVSSIWEYETAQSVNGRHIIAGNWAATSGSLVINPSYFSPHAYRLFARLDPAHDWQDVIDTGYRDLRNASSIIHQRDQDLFLPPDWVEMDRISGEFRPFEGKQNSIDYSYDAFRTFWRVAMDDILNNSDEARAYLAESAVFGDKWKKDNRVCSVYSFSDPGNACSVDIGTLAGPLSVFSRTEPKLTAELLKEFHFAGNNIDVPQAAAFYEKSWYWFGLWLWVMG